MFSAQLTKAYQTAAVLFEVLSAVNRSESVELDNEVGFYPIFHLEFTSNGFIDV